VYGGAGDDVVGREQELALLDAFLRGLGGGAALRLEGAAGVGKTALVREALARARPRSFRVLACSPAEAERSLSYAALGDLVEPAQERLARLPEPQRRALEVALVLAADDDAAPDQRAVAAATLSLLRSLARDGPVLVVVDDVQWLDQPSAHALRFALRRLESEPVGLLTALRVARGNTDPLLPEESVDAIERVTIPPLELEELARVLRSRAPSLSRAAIAQIHRLAEGNPLHALELARALDDHAGSVGLEALAVPPSLGELLRRRISGLAAPAREALVLAAAASHPTAALLERAGSTALADALGAGIVDLDEGRIRFRHPLFASAAYREAGADERRRAHLRLADAVDDDEERARHLAEAAEGPDEAVAAALEAAAEAARRRGAPAAASELAALAVRLTPAGEGAAAQRRLLASARHLFEAGDARRASELLEDALRSARPGPESARALKELATVRGEVEGPHVAAALYARALDEAGPDAALSASLHHLLALTVGLAEDQQSALPHARAAVALAERAGDTAQLAQALGMLGTLEFVLAQPLDEARWRRALALEEAAAEPLWIDVSPSVQFGRVLFWLGRLAEARDLFRHVYDGARRRGDASLSTLEWCLGYVEVRAGRWEEALRHADAALELVRLSGRDAAEAPFLALRAWAHAHLGNVDAARADGETAIREAIATRQTGPEIQARSALGLLELSLGDARAAREHLETAHGLAERGGVEDPGMYPYPPDYVEALALLGEDEYAERLLAAFEEKGRRLERPSVSAAAARCGGILAARRGRREAATAAFERALGEAERTEQPFERARALLAYGSAERRFQQRRAARGVLEEAQELFASLGARQWAERTRDELRQLGGRPSRPGKLTPTEQRIAELVASGRSNHEVANALFIAPKTVEWNLSKIYRKLRVGSRTELAAKLRRDPGAPG
jgi:DNA-binding CsgD family transcriptional regulator